MYTTNTYWARSGSANGFVGGVFAAFTALFLWKFGEMNAVNFLAILFFATASLYAFIGGFYFWAEYKRSKERDEYNYREMMKKRSDTKEGKEVM